MTYSVVLLDSDHTLLDFDAAETMALARTLRDCVMPEPERYLDTYHAINRDLRKKAEQGLATVRLHLAGDSDLAVLETAVLPYTVEISSTDSIVAISVPTDKAASGVLDVIGRMRDADIALEGVTVTEPSLEEVFIALTGTSVTAKAESSEVSEGAA